jgi:hypothetical protein
VSTDDRCGEGKDVMSDPARPTGRVDVPACSGGILAAMTAAYFAATGRQERLAALNQQLRLAETVAHNLREATS